MTITAYTGLPGHGKSYGVVENVIAPALKELRQVFTNIPMNEEICLSRYGMAVTQFDIKDIIENSAWWSEVFVPGSLIVIDEIWQLWPAGTNARNVRDQDKSFLAEHRHLVGENGLATEIVFVTQDLSQIANFARSLIETTFRVTKLTNLGLKNHYRVDVYYGAVTGASPPISKRVSEIQGKFKKEVYALYKSHTKSMTGSAGNENRVDGRFNVLKGLNFRLGIAAGVVALCFAAYLIPKTLKAYNYDSTTVKATDNPDLSATPTGELPSTPIISSSRKQHIKFLSEADDIYISYNNGRFPKIQYRFTVNQGGNFTHLTSANLLTLDYTVDPVNECMVKVSGPDYNGVVLCKREDSQGFIEEMLGGSSDT